MRKQLRKNSNTINNCIHCEKCAKEDEVFCPVFNDGMNEIYEKCLNADVFFFASPVYLMAPSPLIFSFFSRLRVMRKYGSKAFWCDKVGCGFAVGGTRNGVQETTLVVLNHMITTTGMILGGNGVFAYNGASVWSKDCLSKGVDADDLGLRTVDVTARRAVNVARAIKIGTSQMPEFNRITFAGFKDEADKQVYIDYFSSKK